MAYILSLKFVFLVVLSSIFLVSTIFAKRYEPNWDSIDSRPLPSWYDEGKIGIFITWGVFSVPSFGSEWFWDYLKRGQKKYVDFMAANYRPGFTYADFASMFTAEFYNPDEWADLFQAAGARYIVFTSKHSEGFTNWPSNVSFNWNSMDVGPKRDLVGELATSIRNRTDLHFGLYHCLFEWFHPLYLQDVRNKYTTRNFVEQKTTPEMYEIVNKYKPDVFWSDGPMRGPDAYWNGTEFLAWLYNDSPVKDTVVANDRWCDGCLCKHGGFHTCTDRYNPGVLQKHKWENCFTIDKKSWGYRRNAQLNGYLSPEQIIYTMVETISCGGNILINVGPSHDGLIKPIYEERLRQMGQWLKVNGEAIYSSVPWSHQKDTTTPRVWYTSKKGDHGVAVYAIVFNWPKGDNLQLGAPMTSEATTVSMIGYHGGYFNWKKLQPSGIEIQIPPIPFNKMPCQWAWVFKIEGLLN